MIMGRGFFISHPEVVVDAAVPVPKWHLSDHGISRMRTFAASLEVADLSAVWASPETKAIEAAGILAAHFGLPVHVHNRLHENDRSATGFLAPPEFESVANAFFAHPHENVRGWEKAIDAQRRVSDAVSEIIRSWTEGNIALVAHGGVGTLLLCQFLGVPIDRALDQPFQGHYWVFDIASRRVLEQWKPLAPRIS
jgi:broad specificity phosphatase PhoE